MSIKRNEVDTLKQRLSERRSFIQVLIGPRQVGKTTIVRQVMEGMTAPTHYASADDPGGKSSIWIEEQWELMRSRLSSTGSKVGFLVLDEIQKAGAGWSETVKKLWDEDSFAGRELYLVLLGSSALLVQKGLSESLAGRFELIHVPHWSYLEMGGAFGVSLDEYIYFGGYPGAIALKDDPQRWSAYIRDSLIETVLSRDILLLNPVDKPALLRALFSLACSYSSQILSFNKMLGQLQDAGNTTTLSGYLRLLEAAFLVSGLQKFSGSKISSRSSSPKLLVFNTALMSAQQPQTLSELKESPELWGRYVESAIGAHLLNSLRGTGIELYYWRDGLAEVDFILNNGSEVVVIEVKSGAAKRLHKGTEKFKERYSLKRALLIGGNGMPIQEFFGIPVRELFR